MKEMLFYSQSLHVIRSSTNEFWAEIGGLILLIL